MDNFFTHFIVRNTDADPTKRLAYASWFVQTIPSNHFSGDEKLFYDFLEYTVTLGISAEFRYFDKWIASELKEILHRDKVRVPGCETLRFEDPVSFETIFHTTSAVLTDDFKRLLTLESLIEDFAVEAAAYFKRRRKALLTEVLRTTFERLNETESEETALNYARDELDTIEFIYSDDNLAELSIIQSGVEDTALQQLVSDTGLPAIDKDSGGIFTTQLVGVEAQSGAGKTRFVLGTYVYRALTVHHKNVLFLALEQTETEIKAMLVACHTFHMFGIQIPDSMILQNKVPVEYQSQVNAARIDLFDSGKYGKFKVFETSLYVESFIGRLRTWDRLFGPFDLIVIDYMGLMESQAGEYQRVLQEFEIIRQSFRLFKKYLRRSRKAGIAVSQFNTAGVNAGSKDKEITTDMAQGGMAVYRNTDYNVAISFTETMRLQSKRRVSQPKVRSTAGFPPFIMVVRLGILYFNQVMEKSV